MFIMYSVLFFILVFIFFSCYSFIRVIIVRKFFLLGVLLLLCGCSFVDDGIRDMNSTKYGLAKNSVSGYANAVKVAYTDYQYASALGTYEVLDGSTVVNVDGVDVNLNVKYYGDDVSCSSISVVDGSVKLDGCLIYGYEFKYDGEAIQK